MALFSTQPQTPSIGSPPAADAAGRYERERTAHNKIFSEDTRKSADKFYRVIDKSRALYEQVLRSRGRGGSALEYGCGKGRYSPFLARHGAAQVVGIDISDVAIEDARADAFVEGLDLEYVLMNAEALTFAAESFDLICGVAILHHLDLARAFGELARTLKPGGTAVFMEPLGHNPAINLYRRMTPGMRTVDEHPLLMRDLKLARQYFASVQLHFFGLQSLAAVPFHSQPYFRRLLSGLETADAALFRALPFMTRYAWQVVLVLEQPLKPGALSR